MTPTSAWVKSDHKRPFPKHLPQITSANSLYSLSNETFVDEVNQALAVGFSPSLTMDGTSGTYILRGTTRKPLAVFKPLDEEPFAPLNPRNYVGTLGSHGFRSGVLSGQAGYREVAAYVLDHGHFSNVPATVLANMQHSSLNYPHTAQPWPKPGSLQVYVPNIGSSEDFSSSLFSKHEVHKIAILDIRYLNMDRNESNLLVTQDHSLVPIDHGLTFPESLDICTEDLCWMSWPQAREPLSEEVLGYVRRLDPVSDMMAIQRLFRFSDASLKNYRAAHVVLKTAIAAGLTLNQVGSLIYRQDFESTSSKLEQILAKAEEFLKAANQSLAARLIPERKAIEVKTFPGKRDRAMSDNDIEYRFGSQLTVSSPTCSTASYSESPDGIITISEETDEETTDESRVKRFKSVPDFLEISPSEELAFNDVFFFHVETLVEQEVQVLMKSQAGRVRSYSMAVENSLPLHT